MIELEKRLRDLVGLKNGNKEVAVFYEPSDDSWSVHIGNPTQTVMLGEVWGEVSGNGKTLSEAIDAAEVLLRSNTVVKRCRPDTTPERSDNDAASA